jgi:hypothetical protein
MLVPTRADLFNIGAEEVISRALARPPDQRISREAITTEGTDINIILASCSGMANEIMRQVVAHCGAFFLDSAESRDLDRLVADRYAPDIVRKPPVAAVVPLTFSRPNPAGAFINLPVGYKVRTVRGTEFVLTQVLSIPAGSTAPVTVPAQAFVVGTTGNVQAQTITQFIAQPPDPVLTVTNLEPASGGADTESDASLRSRCRDFFRTARRGTLAAIQFGALTVPGVSTANAIEDLDPFTGDPSGVVRVYIADALGQGNTVLANAVRIALLEYRAAGIVVDVFGAVPRYEDIRLRLRFLPGTDTGAAFEEVRFLLVSEVNALMPGETLPASLILATARRVPGVIVLADALLEPLGDVVPVGSEIVKTRADLITAEFA